MAELSKSIPARTLQWMVDHAVDGLFTGRYLPIGEALGCSQESIASGVGVLVDGGRVECVKRGSRHPGTYRILKPEPMMQYAPTESVEWSLERKEELKTLRREGHTKRVIAKRLGVTENSVVGKIGRLFATGELERRTPPQPGVAKPRRSRAKPKTETIPVPFGHGSAPRADPVATAGHDQRASVPVIFQRPITETIPSRFAPTPHSAMVAPKPVVIAGHGKCQYPMWATGARPTHIYCDAQTSELGSPWCGVHRKICFTRGGVSVEQQQGTTQ